MIEAIEDPRRDRSRAGPGDTRSAPDAHMYQCCHVVMLNGRTTDNFPTCDEGSKRRRPTSDQKQEVDNINKNHTLCDLTMRGTTNT
jgi:hypothetical protein